MTSYDYCTADVFTDHVFGGNPLAVLLDARGIDDGAMQSIAREFNYSETTFVLPPSDPRCTARVRIFTPGGELPFAGHPTVGTAFVLASLGRIDTGVSDIVFEEAIGPVPVRIDRTVDGRVTCCTLTTAQQPEFLAAIDDRGAMAAMLGLDAAAVSSTPEVWSCGVPFLVVPLARVDALARARLDLERWRDMLAGAVTQKVYLDRARRRRELASPHVRPRTRCRRRPGHGFRGSVTGGLARAPCHDRRRLAPLADPAGPGNRPTQRNHARVRTARQQWPEPSASAGVPCWSRAER